MLEQKQNGLEDEEHTLEEQFSQLFDSRWKKTRTLQSKKRMSNNQILSLTLHIVFTETSKQKHSKNLFFIFKCKGSLYDQIV